MKTSRLWNFFPLAGGSPELRRLLEGRAKVSEVISFMESDIVRCSLSRISSSSFLTLGRSADAPLSYFYFERIILSLRSIRDTEYLNFYSLLSYLSYSSSVLSSSLFFVFGFDSPAFRRTEEVTLTLRLAQSLLKTVQLRDRLRVTASYDTPSMKKTADLLKRMIGVIVLVSMVDSLDLLSFANRWWSLSLLSSVLRMLTVLLGNCYHY